MTDLVIQEPLASRIREVARRDNLTPDELLAILVDWHSPPPRPASSLTDDDIEVPDDIQDKEAYRQAARELAPKPY